MTANCGWSTAVPTGSPRSGDRQWTEYTLLMQGRMCAASISIRPTRTGSGIGRALEPYRQSRAAAVRLVDYSEGETARQLAPLSFDELSSKAARVVVASSIKNCW